MAKYEPVRNEALYKAMVDIRRSNRAQPHKNKKHYTRTTKHHTY